MKDGQRFLTIILQQRAVENECIKPHRKHMQSNPNYHAKKTDTFLRYWGNSLMMHDSAKVPSIRIQVPSS